MVGLTPDQQALLSHQLNVNEQLASKSVGDLMGDYASIVKYAQQHPVEKKYPTDIMGHVADLSSKELVDFYSKKSEATKRDRDYGIDLAKAKIDSDKLGLELDKFQHTKWLDGEQLKLSRVDKALREGELKVSEFNALVNEKKMLIDDFLKKSVAARNDAEATKDKEVAKLLTAKADKLQRQLNILNKPYEETSISERIAADLPLRLPGEMGELDITKIGAKALEIQDDPESIPLGQKWNEKGPGDSTYMFRIGKNSIEKVDLPKRANGARVTLEEVRNLGWEVDGVPVNLDWNEKIDLINFLSKYAQEKRKQLTEEGKPVTKENLKPSDEEIAEFLLEND